MGEIKWGNREITNITEKPGKFGTYKVLTTIDGKGKQREERLFDRSLQEAVTKPGAYKFGYEMGESGFPEIVEIQAFNGAQNGPTSHPGVKDVEEVYHKPINQPRSNVRDLDTNRSILVQVCIKAAAEVVASKNLNENDAITMADKFLRWAEKELNKGDAQED